VQLLVKHNLNSTNCTVRALSKDKFVLFQTKFVSPANTENEAVSRSISTFL